MANEQNLTPWKPGQSGNPRGASRKSRARAQLFRMFGGAEKVNAEVLVALVAKATDRPELLKVEVKDKDGNKAGERTRQPDLAWMRELISLLWGDDKSQDLTEMFADVQDGQKRIVIPDVDERAERPKRARKAKPSSPGGDVPA